MKDYRYKLFFKANFVITSLIFLLFLTFNNSYTLKTFILSLLGTISTSAIFYLIFMIILFTFKPLKRVIFFIAGSLFVMINLALIIDFFIFKIYKFHINGMVLNILFSPDAIESIQLGWQPVSLLIVFVISLIVLEIFMYKKIKRLDIKRQKHINTKFNLYITMPLTAIIVFEKLTYGLMIAKNSKEYLTSFRVIPMYIPFRFNSFAYKHLGIKPNKSVKNTINTNATLNYPGKMITFDKKKKFNILIIASDATRYSVIDSKTTPNLTNFKDREAIDFTNHYSGGYSTRFGIFSLMYGINSTYWFNFLDANRGSVLFDSLKKLGFEISIIFSTSASWPEFKKTCFAGIEDSVKDNFKGKPWQKDMKSSKYLIESLKRHNKNKPFFSFLFMDAPHGYSYPPEFNKFDAKKQNINYIAVSKDSKETKLAFARYKNAVYFIDSRFKKIVDTLKSRGIYDDTMIIFTSDHGQEFYEFGYLGHNSAFDEAQTHVPFFVKLPKSLSSLVTTKKITSLSSHLDLVPTLLSLLGAKNKYEDYSNGYNLFDKNFKRDFVFCGGWNYNSIKTKKYTYIFSNRPDDLFKNEIRDTKSYKLLPNKSVDTKLLIKVVEQNRAFLN